MTENRHIPELRFPEFDGDWEKKKLGDLLEFKNGINASKEQYGKGVKFINVLDILNNDFITHDKIIGSVDVDSETADLYSVKYGDILFQRSSETREEVGTANVYVDKDNNATFGGFVIRGRKISEYVPVFLNKLLKTDSARDEITSKSGGSTRYNVGQGTLSSVELLFPSLPEQKKIATFLTAIDKRINLLSKQKIQLELYKKGLMHKIFNQELRFKDDNGDDFPNWEEKRLGEIAFKKSSNISANSLSENYGSYKIYGATGFLQNVDFYREKEAYISIIKDGAGVGRLFLCEPYTSVLGTLDIINIKDNNNLYFLYLLLSTIDFTKYITGSTIPHIYFKDYSKEKLKIPNLDEQIKIASFLSIIDLQIEKTKYQIDKSIEYKKSLLQKLFI